MNVWVSTPSFIEMCLLLPNLNEQQYSSLKQFFFCGEILPHKTAKALVERLKMDCGLFKDVLIFKLN